MISLGDDILASVPEFRHGLVRRSARELIADKLLALIATGVLRTGDELPGERALAAALDVSRETVRGAVQALAARGVVEVSQGSRSRIATVDFTDVPVTIAAPKAIDGYELAAVHEARLLVELQVVGDAAERITPADVERLESSLAAQRDLDGDPVRFLICDREFHVTIYRAAGNPLLADFVTDLYTYMMQHRRYAMARPGAIEASYADHVAIVAGLRAGDRAAVIAAFRQHLERIEATTRAIIGPAAPPRSTPSPG